MRHESESAVAQIARRMRGRQLHRSETGFTASVHARAARGIWPSKTAEHWAAEAGVSPRMAKFWLAGTHDVSDTGKLALTRVLNR